ncbi:uncharacterized protein DS421_18g609880 [Arachis hypogaea]|nr:uncharacterized protein DS421_18g609880 [Arachis hypogaea]
MDPATAERLYQMNQAIENVENAKREEQQTLALFWEHMPAIDPSLIRDRMLAIQNKIQALENRKRALILEREFLIVGAASSIRGEQGGNN